MAVAPQRFGRGHAPDDGSVNLDDPSLQHWHRERRAADERQEQAERRETPPVSAAWPRAAHSAGKAKGLTCAGRFGCAPGAKGERRPAFRRMVE